MKFMQHFVLAGDRRAPAAMAFLTALLASVTLSATSMAAGLNDTGFTTCADAAGATVSCTAASAVQGQDARYGRDAAAGTSALTKVGGGANGFDFTKISNAGAVLPSTAPLGTAAGEWGCTYDNTTGLMWEVKTFANNPPGLRWYGYWYSWYSTNSATNGGGVGSVNGGTCFVSGRCDTEKFVQDVNATNMCGHSDWRMPTFRELQGLVQLNMGPTIDTSYFPNSDAAAVWSGSPYVGSSALAWYVSFADGRSGGQGRGNIARVRLMRSGQ